MTETLLPPNSTPLERALDAMAAAALDLPAPTRDLYRPQAAPAALIPFAAFGVSADLWDRGWSIEAKRAQYARAIPWHRIKGTEAAISEAIAAHGGDVRKFVVPPSKTFLMPKTTDAERREFLARFAQVRVYPFVAAGVAAYQHFTSAANGRGKAFLGDGFPANARASDRYRRTAFLVDGGVETPLTVRDVAVVQIDGGEAVEFDEIALPARATRSIHLGGRPMGKAFLVDDQGPGRRIVQVPRSVGYSYRVGQEAYTTTMPDADLINIRPEAVSQPHPRRSGSLFLGHGCIAGVRYLAPSVAWRFIYSRVYIHDKKRLPSARPRSTHIGHTRLSIPAYHAEVHARIINKRPARAVSRYCAGYFVAGDRSRLNGAIAGAAAAKAVRDKLLLGTKTHRPIRAGDRVRAGVARVGQLIEV